MRKGLVSTLLVLGGCAPEGTIFVALENVPETLRWMAALPIGDDRSLRPGTPLFDRETAPISEPLELEDGEELLLLAYPDEFLRPLPKVEILGSSAIRPSTADAFNLPRPSLGLRGRIEGGTFSVLDSTEPGPLTADWVSCPPDLGNGGLAMASCVNCVGRVSRQGCRLRVDLRACGLETVDLSVGAQGALSSPEIAGTALGECSLSESETALSKVECSFPARAGGCALDLIEPPAPDPFELLPLLDVEPFDEPYGGDRLPGGYLFGLAAIGTELLVLATPDEPQQWTCTVGLDERPSLAIYVDREGFDVTRTRATPPCMRWPVPDPHDDAGFLAIFARDGAHQFGRFDSEARLQSSVELGSFLEWHVSDLALLSDRRAAVALVKASGDDLGRIVFLELDQDGLSTELDHPTDSTFIVALSRISDTAVGVLSDGSDNVRVVDLGTERAHYYVANGCGVPNLSSADLWMSEDESRAVGAFRDSGTLLLMDLVEGRCRFARAPVHPDTLDPIAIVPMGDELIISFWGRELPRRASLGRLDLSAGHLRSSFTDLGPGIVNRLLVDRDVVYGTLTDRATLVRLRPAP